MAVRMQPPGGEYVPIDKNDQSSAARAFSRPPGSQQGPLQGINRQAGSPKQNAPQPQRTFANRLCLAIWHGGGWEKETIEMLDGFYEADGQQDRSCFILQTSIHPTTRAVMEAAQRAFVDVKTIETPFADPSNGIITPYALYDFAGSVAQTHRHVGRIFFTMPLRVVGPDSLARLEQEAQAANPGRGTDNKNLGRPILGAIRINSKGEKFPFSSFVAVSTWVREPEFPLVKGLNKMPAKTSAEIPMNFLRYELLRGMATTGLINPQPDKNPSDPRFVLLEARDFGERFPVGQVVVTPDVPSFEAENADPFNPPSVESLRQIHAFQEANAAKMETAAAQVKFHEAITGGLALPELPEDALDRVSKEGLGWLKDYACPTNLSMLASLHNTERRRTMPPDELKSSPTPAKKAAPAKKVSPKKKAALPTVAA